MTDKEKVIRAIDDIAETLSILIRINYDNPAQLEHNKNEAIKRLRKAVNVLQFPLKI